MPGVPGFWVWGFWVGLFGMFARQFMRSLQVHDAGPALIKGNISYITVMSG